MHVSVEIPSEPEAVAIARDVVACAVAEATAPEQPLEDLRLLTSEVVTNAVRHAGSRPGETIGMSVDVSASQVRVEVADRGPGFDPATLSEPSSERIGGWGLHLVRQLADAWGVIGGEPSSVWFEMSL